MTRSAGGKGTARPAARGHPGQVEGAYTAVSESPSSWQGCELQHGGERREPEASSSLPFLGPASDAACDFGGSYSAAGALSTGDRDVQVTATADAPVAKFVFSSDVTASEAATPEIVRVLLATFAEIPKVQPEYIRVA